jgi:hypothetical protein
MSEQQLERVAAQLRHAYHQLIGPDASWDREQRMRFADGLIAPQIVVIEALLAALPVATDGWQDISTFTQDGASQYLFWVIPKTNEELGYNNTSPWIGEPHLYIGTYQSWSSVDKATHWRTLHAPPADAPQEHKDQG